MAKSYIESAKAWFPQYVAEVNRAATGVIGRAVVPKAFAVMLVLSIAIPAAATCRAWIPGETP